MVAGGKVTRPSGSDYRTYLLCFQREKDEFDKKFSEVNKQHADEINSWTQKCARLKEVLQEQEEHCQTLTQQLQQNKLQILEEYREELSSIKKSFTDQIGFLQDHCRKEVRGSFLHKSPISQFHCCKRVSKSLWQSQVCGEVSALLHRSCMETRPSEKENRVHEDTQELQISRSYRFLSLKMLTQDTGGTSSLSSPTNWTSSTICAHVPRMRSWFLLNHAKIWSLLNFWRIRTISCFSGLAGACASKSQNMSARFLEFFTFAK